MKTTFLSLAFAASIGLAASACNSTKSVSGSADSTVVDTSVTTTPADTAMKDTVIKDTGKTMPPDTTKVPKM